MKARAAVLRNGGEPWGLTDLDLVDLPGRERGGSRRGRRSPPTAASPQACADCLVPKDLMRGTLGLPEDAIDLMYPLDSPPER
jgi:hypothetical protein